MLAVGRGPVLRRPARRADLAGTRGARRGRISRPDPARTAIWLSLVTSIGATTLAVVLGIPLAWVQARTRYPGQHLVRALTTLPMVLPPVVGGIALQAALGRRGLVGQHLGEVGIQLPFHLWAPILASTFVSMPFFVLTVEGALRSVDPRLEDAAHTLGAGRWSAFWHVTLPMIRPSLVRARCSAGRGRSVSSVPPSPSPATWRADADAAALRLPPAAAEQPRRLDDPQPGPARRVARGDPDAPRPLARRAGHRAAADRRVADQVDDHRSMPVGAP